MLTQTATIASAAGLRVFRPRVLVADDHPTNRKVIEMMLTVQAVEITNAADGREAVEAYGAARFDLVLMDVQMPVMDGLEAIRRIRALEAERGWPRTPVAVLSADVGDEHDTAARAAGADHHIAKPIDVRALLDVVAEALATACAADARSAAGWA